MTRPILFVLALAVGLPQAGAAQTARPLAEFARDRHRYDVMSDRACAGDRMAEQLLLIEAEGEENPAAMVARAWLLVTKDCAFYTGDEEEAYRLNAEAAKSGYPVAISNMGFRMIDGLGTSRAPRKGASLVVEAARGGYGDALAHLSIRFSKGDGVPRNLPLARQLVERADRMEVDEALMTRAWGTYHTEAGD